MRYGPRTNQSTFERDNWFKYRFKGSNKVLLREPERCWECGAVYISLYPLRQCVDHDGLEKI
ncbi:MAG: hypothetical protein BMS9Abin23_0540 [Thermodesulfobacteriota bacterium]|nr:MAG: hypothetical protein BMS9Abin23_0540 [Thermodesulfobacteriota bacterium]